MTGEDMNKFIADDRRKHQEKYKKLEGAYLEMVNDESLPAEQRRNLEAELRELQRSFRTEQSPPATEDRDWHKMYEDAVKNRAELDAKEAVK